MWRLIASALLLLLSLLTVFKAPTNFLWRVSVAVTEFPYMFIGVSFVFIFIVLKKNKYRVISFVLTGIALAFYSLPVIRAYQRGVTLKEELSLIFPFDENTRSIKRPYSFVKMFSGIEIKKNEPVIYTYKHLPDKDLNLDFYSCGNTKAPCVIVIHGGSWSEGDSKQLPNLNYFLAGKGYHVAAINYRLAPKHRSPAQVQDTRDVINYLVKNNVKLNIDTTNFVLLGRSAGGQIALVSAYSLKDEKIKGVVSFYAPADMVWGGKIKVGKLVLNTEKVFNEYLGGSIEQVPQKFAEASSCEYVNRNSTPTLLIHGENDAMVSFEHSVRLSAKLNQNHVKHYFLDLPWATHGCDYNINGPSGQISTFAIEQFINSVTTD